MVVNGAAVTRAGAAVQDGDEIVLKIPPRFVSRGGDKLDHALVSFDLDVHGQIAADFGASTGGFTDCLLQQGAERVYAIDVGYGQLAERLRLDPRVVVMDRNNVRNLVALPEVVDVVTIDVAFIGLRLVLPAALRVMNDEGHVIALVKPQFEVGRGEVGRGGVVRDPAAHRRVLDEFFATARGLELGVVGLVASPLRGPAGNVEFLAHLSPGAPSVSREEAIEKALNEAALV